MHAHCASTHDPSWTHYGNTILVFENGRTIDLRQPIGAPEQHLLQSLDLVGEFAIVTACNPGGISIARDENLRRSRKLESDLEDRQLPWISVTGTSIDGSHGERSCAFRIEAQAAMELARDMGQSAFFWFDGAAFWIRGACIPTAPIRLPLQS